MTKILREIAWFFSGTLGWFVKVLASILVVGAVTAAICTTVFALYIDRYIKPAVENIDVSDMTLNYTSFVYAVDEKTGKDIELEQLYDENNRVWIDYEKIPKAMWQAVVAVEDSRFLKHAGVDWIRTTGAMVNMIIPLRDKFGGGSTLTQQLIKNLTGEDDVTVQRKVQEILRALEFEKHHTKEDILELYLNIVYFGRGCNGIETAARTYFDKSAADLSVAECAAIAAITNSPTKYDPIRKPENNKQRRELILTLMYNQEFLTQAQYQKAMAEELQLNPNASIALADRPKQSYYVDQVITDVLADLQSELGYSPQAASNLLFSGGLKIYSCIDLEIQAILDGVYKNDADFPKVQEERQPESAMVIMDPYTGKVVAMVGGRGEKTVARAWNRATMTKRPPGSSIKPLTVYAPAIEYGFITPATVLDDSPLNEETMFPKNQSSGFTGRMTVKRAIQRSTNTVAVKVLDLVTPERAFSFGSVNLGLDLVRSVTVGGKVFSDVDYSPLALGGTTYGLSVLEMTAAYGAFVNRGIFTEPRTYTKVLDSKGNVLLNNEAQSQVAMKEKTAYYINNLLRNAVETGTGLYARIPNVVVAGKTGTTNDDFDRWFVGYTPNYVAAVWYGFDNPREIKMQTSRNPSVEIWQMVMSQVQVGLEYENFFQLDTVQAQYCQDSGLKPSQYCALDPRGSRITTGTFLPEDVPTKTCTAHVPVTICSESGMRAGPFCPEESVVTISLIDVPRSGQISMSDDTYLYHDAVDARIGLPTSNYNIYCTLHTHESTQPPQGPGWLDPGEEPGPDEGETGEEPGETPDPGETTAPPDETPGPGEGEEDGENGGGSSWLDWFG